nr:NADH dehydrogenase subunit 6 [Eusarima sp.]
MTSLMIINTIFTPMMKHPISLGTILMLQTINMSMYMSKNSYNSWFAYILFITIIGGMMVLFMYMSSISSNEKFSPSWKMTIMYLIIITITLLTNKQLIPLMEEMKEMKQMNEIMEMKSTSKFFNSNKYTTTILMIMILLLTMNVVSNIASSFEGPLKKTYV